MAQLVKFDTETGVAAIDPNTVTWIRTYNGVTVLRVNDSTWFYPLTTAEDMITIINEALNDQGTWIEPRSALASVEPGAALHEEFKDVTAPQNVIDEGVADRGEPVKIPTIVAAADTDRDDGNEPDA